MEFLHSEMGEMIRRSWFCMSFLRSRHNWLNNAIQSFLQEALGKVSYLLVLGALEKNVLPPIKNRVGSLFWSEGV